MQDAKVTAEQQIIVRLTAKCAEVVEGADYDWVTKEAQESPSGYINDCLRFLETTFHALQILPVSSLSLSLSLLPLFRHCVQEDLVSNLLQQALKNLARLLEMVLLAESNPRVSMEAIRTFGVDLTRCQSKSPSCGTPVLSLTPGFVMATVSNYSCLRGTDASLAFEPLKQVLF